MTIDHAQKIADQIKTWNCNSVSELVELLNSLESVLEAEGPEWDITDYIDITSDLPSADFPDDVDEDAPVWAIDNHDNLLVGDTARETITLAEYRDIKNR